MVVPINKRLIQCDLCHARKNKEELKRHMKIFHDTSSSIKARNNPNRERRKGVLLKALKRQMENEGKGLSFIQIDDNVIMIM